MRIAFAAIAALMCAVAPAQAREPVKTGAIWERNLLAKQGQERGCFYATVSRREDFDYPNATLNLYFRREPDDRRYSSSHFPFNPFRAWGKDDFLVDGDTGDILEACVPPGRYAFSNFSFIAGGLVTMITWPRDFRPRVFEVQAGRDYYLGNFHLQPGPGRDLVLRDRLERDAALIRQHAKHAPATELQPLALTGRGGSMPMDPAADLLRRL